MSTAPATKAGFVLASKSASRRAMLDQAGAAYECVPADIDEREIEARRSSHAYLVEQREAEPWSPAKLHAPDARESLAMRERCFGRRSQ